MAKDKLDKVGQAIQAKIDRTKKRIKRLCYYGCGWTTVGLILFILGIALVAIFGKYMKEKEDKRRGAGIFGGTLIFIGLIVVTIGLGFWITLYIIYRRHKRIKKPLIIPTFEYGKAPYPQQPPSSQTMSPQPPPPGQPDSPEQPSAPPADQKDVHVDISEHQRF